MIIPPAYAQAANAGPSGLEIIFPFILIFAVFYFLLIRPQIKKQKQHREMITGLRRGDRVVTGGGIVGKVEQVGEGDEIVVRIADNVRVQVMRSTILEVVKPKPAGEKAGGTKAVAGGEAGASGLAKAFSRLLGALSPGRGKEGEKKE